MNLLEFEDDISNQLGLLVTEGDQDIMKSA